MLANLLAGTAVISATVIIHLIGLIAVTDVTASVTGRLNLHRRWIGVISMILSVLGIFLVMSVEIWLWAVFHFFFGVVPDFATALYFSTTTFATVGYGDVIPAEEWRLFAALEGVNGFLLIGWSTAYLVAAGIRIGPFRAGEHF
ncbi:potassium channel family protein [Mesorhizobium marinum]|uniref:Potassium channel family protein n=1 Tax=Mesorhizobium marinum TaxID=3228790 RepID=A0ABV3QW18_9HYPH